MEMPEVENSPPTVMKFFAPWCGPCKTYSPVVEKVCEELGFQLKSVNIDELDEATKEEYLTRYSIKSVPTLVIRANGYEKTLIGTKKEEELRTELKNAL